jgi:hypothetical protein
MSSRSSKLRRGSTGWLCVAIGTILWDALAEEDEQLTYAFRRGFKTRKILVSAAWGYLTCHLFGAIPDRYDIIHYIGTAYRRRLHGYQGSSPA